jgi:hypothetical protein
MGGDWSLGVRVFPPWTPLFNGKYRSRRRCILRRFNRITNNKILLLLSMGILWYAHTVVWG